MTKAELERANIGNEWYEKIMKSDDPMYIIILSHTLSEVLIDYIIDKEIPHSSLLKDFNYNQKLKIIRAMNLLSKELYDNLCNLGTFRNKYAHRADRITFDEIKNISFHPAETLNGPKGFTVNEYSETMPDSEKMQDITLMASVLSFGWLNNFVIESYTK